MARIKFVLWERYRAWWGAHELNQQDPMLLDRIKEEERAKQLENMSAKELRRLASKEERELQRLRAKRLAAEVAAKEAKIREQQEAKKLAEFQRLAAGAGPELKKET
jgi:hypothetical protein